VKSAESFGKQRKVRKCYAMPMSEQIIGHNDSGDLLGRAGDSITI